MQRNWGVHDYTLVTEQSGYSKNDLYFGHPIVRVLCLRVSTEQKKTKYEFSLA